MYVYTHKSHCQKRFYELHTAPICYEKMFYKPFWAWAWVWMSQPRQSAYFSGVSGWLIGRLLCMLFDRLGCSVLLIEFHVKRKCHHRNSNRKRSRRETLRFASRCWQLPDGVRTNGVVAEVPQFPLMNFQGKSVGKTWQNETQHFPMMNLVPCCAWNPES